MHLRSATLRAIAPAEAGQYPFSVPSIASLSPILMAFPGATIMSFDGGAVQQVAYAEVEHVTLTRDFLNSPARFLRHL